MAKLKEFFLFALVYIGMFFMMLSFVLPYGNFTAWGEFTKGIAQIKVTVALGYAALIAAIAATQKHAGQFSKNKKALYNIIRLFCLMIFLDMFLYGYSFNVFFQKVNLIIYAGSTLVFIILTVAVLKLIRMMINIEE
ncbi:hypothetical protein AB432_010175 [Brevibacillus brevis]|uniref:Uncharacterized protein n=1 Tax=Brevibacillus brevis TaxID=1393 RepID=A0A2Z4MFZ5_BREBE|nr:hypothetical protein [Brevibacillus brevis]AWX55386.1 hypothetical protein AB432_010175 [Brevibacillus brevis]